MSVGLGLLFQLLESLRRGRRMRVELAHEQEMVWEMRWFIRIILIHSWHSKRNQIADRYTTNASITHFEPPVPNELLTMSSPEYMCGPGHPTTLFSLSHLSETGPRYPRRRTCSCYGERICVISLASEKKLLFRNLIFVNEILGTRFSRKIVLSRKFLKLSKDQIERT